MEQLGLDIIERLTQREIDVVKYIAYGYPANYIAKQLSLSNRTIKKTI